MSVSNYHSFAVDPSVSLREAGQASLEGTPAPQIGTVSDWIVTERGSCGCLNRSYTVISINGLNHAKNSAEREALVVEEMLRRAIFYGLLEGFFTRKQVRGGSLDTCRSIARLAVLELCVFEIEGRLGSRALKYMPVQRQILALNKRPDAQKQFKRLSQRLVGKREASKDPNLQGLDKKISDLAESWLDFSAGRWRTTLDQGLYRYNHRSIGGWIMGKLI